MEFKAEQKNGWDELKNNWITVKIVEAKIKKTSYWFVDWLVALSTCIDALTSKDEKILLIQKCSPLIKKRENFQGICITFKNFRSHYWMIGLVLPHTSVSISVVRESRNIEFGFELGTDHYLSPEGGWEGDELEVLGLNKVKFSRSPLRMLLHWSDPP